MTPRLGPRRVVAHLLAALRLSRRAAPGTLAAYIPLVLATGAVPVVAAWCGLLIIDRLAAGTPYRWAGLAIPLAGLAALWVGQAAAGQAQRYLAGRLTRAAGLTAMDGLYQAMERMVGIARLEDPAFQDRLGMAEQAGRGWPAHLVDDALAVVRGLITIGGFVGVLAALDPWLAVAVVLAALPGLVVEARLSRERTALLWRITPHHRREHHYAQLLTSIAAAKELRLFGLAGMFRGRMLTELSAVNAAQARQDRRQLSVQGALGTVAALIAAAGLAWAVLEVTRGRLGVGDLTVFVAAVPGTQSSIQSLVERIGTAYQAALMFDHYQAVAGAPPDLPSPVRPRPVPPLRQGIEFDDVWFRYADDTPWVLRGVSLRIPFGATVALAGLNGAGKSTIIKLLCRFYDPTRGSVRWDGADLRELSVVELRARIGALFQDYMTYDLSVAENIGVGDLAVMADRPRVVAAAQRAGADAALAALPRGYDTMLSRTFFSAADTGDPETGVLLSGGQWQRLALARSFLRDRRDLMILDEPSSGLDPEAEHDVHTRLRAQRAGATSVLISHRLGAVRDADLIVLLADGTVAEQGTHHELLAARGRYARLFRLQAAGYAEADHAETAAR